MNTFKLRNTIILLLSLFFLLASESLYASKCDLIDQTTSSHRYETCVLRSQVKNYVKTLISETLAAGKKKEGVFQAYCDLLNRHVEIEEVASFVGKAFWNEATPSQRTRFSAVLHSHLTKLMKRIFSAHLDKTFSIERFKLKKNATQFFVSTEFTEQIKEEYHERFVPTEFTEQIKEEYHEQGDHPNTVTSTIWVTVNKVTSDSGHHFLTHNLTLHPFFEKIDARVYLQKHYTKTFDSIKESWGNIENMIAETEESLEQECQ